MDRVTTVKNNIVVEILVWGLIGLVLSMSIATMIISGSCSIESFYNVGNVYEIGEKYYRSVEVQDKGYQESSGTVVLDNGEFQHTIGLDGKAREWNYFCVNISDLNTDTIECSMLFNYYKDKQLVRQMEKSGVLKDGLNVIETSGQPFQLVYITYTGENNATFTIKDMQFRDSEPVFTYSKFAGITILVFLIYSVFVSIFRKIWIKKNIKVNFYVWIDLLQEIFIKFAEQLVKVKKIFPFFDKYKSAIRTVLFLVLFLFNVWIDMYGSYTARFKYYVIVYLFLIIMIAVVSIESKVQKVCWNNPLVWSWTILWGVACVSDFIIAKDYRFSGYAILFGIGFFIFIWNNMKDPVEILKDFKNAICIFILIIACFCLICRPETADARYAGFGTNPSVFGLYLSVCWAVVLSEIEERIKDTNKLVNLLPYILEMGIVFTFACKSQSACPLISMICIGFIWLVRVSYYLKKNVHKMYLIGIISIAIVILVYIGMDWGINNIPQKLGTTIRLEDEVPIAKKEYGLIVQAADIEETIKSSRLGQKFSSGSLSSVLSGRDYYYRTYLRKMNLFGHERRPVMWGKRRQPHNAIIGISYQYGVLATVPYILMLVFVIIRTFRYSNCGRKYAVLPFYVCLSVIIMSMADNVERPFSWLPWFGLYLLMGIVFKKSE